MRHDSQLRGVTASVVASVLFGVVYFIPSALGELSEFEAVAWRILFTLPFMAVLLVAIRSWREVTDAAARLRARPALIPALVVTAGLLGAQLFLFAWGPKTGHALDVALGYLLMPLVMVVLGVALHRERLGALRIAAVAAALIGVVAAFFAADGISWATAAVAVGYPIYFTIRRALGLDSSGAMWLELVILAPVCVWFALGPASLVADGGSLPWGTLLLFGAVSAVALTLYIVAARLLTFSLFGLLSYVEPIVLVLVSLVLLGEAIAPSEYVTYAGISAAVLLLVVEGIVLTRRERRLGDQPLPPG
ncbi:EamA family transporter RarD [Salinibacterium sp. SYSU T00001]|uniref:EamA family transporter RarD n=1 Tax=Homoserinimonas sedimenticola TaxID=2986805 RepID=UPI00223573D4|nr:EamA family transporter RarD [Salinibacterium sedimenticola]MCW4385135.1 EamA family transporter RarD [Salinibacterium sedimenticola]